MIFDAIRLLQNFGILGINRRNAEYIMQCNPLSSFPLVDDKLLTKRLAEEHQIPTPPLYTTIDYHGDIVKLKNVLEGRRDFVVKPARGAGGSGIVLITDHTEEGFVKQNGEMISWKDLTYHISGILSGIYSLEGLEDRALVEALIHPDPVFARVTFSGVPDIRIVVYRGVPVMGMVRLPTRASDGKANLHRGAIGVGIDIAKGITLTAVHRSQIVTHHPDTGNPVSGLQIPYWEDMLLVAARAVDMTGLGFLGVDMVIDWQRGPLLLELNARPGLQIQIANRMGLRRCLELVDKAPPDIFKTPKARIAWALEIFATSISHPQR
jgi:alpha-L-glutamate ligase-like protein